MKNFKNIEELASYMFEKLNGDDPVSVVADKDLAVSIMQELLNYENVILDICNIDSFEYDREYLVSLYDDTDTDYWYVSIEQIYNYEKEKYFGIDGYVLFHEDINSKALIDMQNNKNIELSGYDWFVIDEDGETDGTETDEKPHYIVNGKSVTKDEYNDFVSRFVSDKVIESGDKSDNNKYYISINCNFDTNEALKIIDDMEHRITHMNDMFREMDNFRRLFNW